MPYNQHTYLVDPDVVEVRTDGRGGFIFTRVVSTPAERVKREQREQQMRERQKLRERAGARSKELFIRLLAEDQRETLASGGYVDVTAKSGRTYRIGCNHGHSGNIYWIDEKSKEVKGSFCIYPGDYDLPQYDSFLGQLLLIATDEDKFLDIGVFHGPIHPTRGPNNYGRAWLY